MKSLLFACTVLGVCSWQSASGQNFDMYVVNPGANPSWAIPNSAEYKFATFTDGFILISDDKRTEDMKLNFSHLMVSPMMINAAGDTVMVAPHMVKEVWIGKSNFLLTENRYFEILTFAEPIRLAKQHYLRVFRSEPVDAFGSVPASRSTQHFGGQLPPGSLDPGGDIRVNARQSFKFQTDFYFITAKDGPRKAKKSTIIKMSRPNHKAVETYIKDYMIEFDNEQDLLRLMDFLQTLPK